MPTVDVIVPCYNYARYLPDCVHSALSQPGVDVRVIIIDDASSDDTARVGGRLAESDGRVHFHRHDLNRGHIATYNEGLDLLTADYMVLLSADDLLTPGALRRATDLMQAHPSVGLVYGYPIPLYGAIPPRARTRVSGWTIWKGADWIELMCRSGRNFINCPEVVMRTSVQRQIGHYRGDLPHSGDMEMWLRAATVSDVGRVNGVDQAYYRIHASSMQRTTHAGFLVDLQGRRDAFQSALEGASDRLPRAGRLLETAKRSLAMAAIRHARQAYDCGREQDEPVEGYCEFAQSLFPAVVETRHWRALERQRRGRRGVVWTIMKRGRARLRNAADYLAWRHWWRTGVH